MSVSKTLLTVLVVLLATGGIAATGLAQTDGADSSARVSDLEMDAALGNETVSVTATDGGAPVANASITVDGERAVTVTTGADGTATVDRSALVGDDESLEELELEYESDRVEGELEYVVTDGALTLTEETYEYEREHEADDRVDDAEGDDEDGATDGEPGEATEESDDRGEDLEDDPEEDDDERDDEDESEDQNEDQDDERRDDEDRD